MKKPRIRTVIGTIALVAVIGGGMVGLRANAQWRADQKAEAAAAASFGEAPGVLADAFDQTAVLINEDVEAIRVENERIAAEVEAARVAEVARVAAEAAAVQAAADEAARQAAAKPVKRSSGGGAVKCPAGTKANAVDAAGNESNCEALGAGGEQCQAYDANNVCTNWMKP